MWPRLSETHGQVAPALQSSDVGLLSINISIVISAESSEIFWNIFSPSPSRLDVINLQAPFGTTHFPIFGFELTAAISF